MTHRTDWFSQHASVKVTDQGRKHSPITSTSWELGLVTLPTQLSASSYEKGRGLSVFLVLLWKPSKLTPRMRQTQHIGNTRKLWHMASSVKQATQAKAPCSRVCRIIKHPTTGSSTCRSEKKTKACLMMLRQKCPMLTGTRQGQRAFNVTEKVCHLKDRAPY